MYRLMILSSEPQPHTAPDQPWRADRLKRRPTDRINLIESVLERDKYLDLASKPLRDEQINERKRTERQPVLIVVKLPAGGAELHRRGDVFRV